MFSCRRPALLTLGDVIVYYHIVDERCEDVHQQDSEHHTLWITRVEDTYEDAHDTHEETIDPLTRLGTSRGDRIGRHKDKTESKATIEQVMRDVELHGSSRADSVEEERHQSRTYYTTHDDLVACHARPDQ